MDELKKTCETCGNFYSLINECRRSAPVPILSNMAVLTTVWPVVRKTDFCGDYFPKDEKTRRKLDRIEWEKARRTLERRKRGEGETNDSEM